MRVKKDFLSVLPSGLSNAPFIFTKVVRPPVKYWRSFGVKLVIWDTQDSSNLGGEAILRELENNDRRTYLSPILSAGNLTQKVHCKRIKSSSICHRIVLKWLSVATVKWYTDNQAACHIFKKESMKLYLQDLLHV